MSNLKMNHETEADTRADRIDPALTALGWTGPDRTEGAKVSREEMLWPGHILSVDEQNVPETASFVLQLSKKNLHFQNGALGEDCNA